MIKDVATIIFLFLVGAGAAHSVGFFAGLGFAQGVGLSDSTAILIISDGKD